MSDAQGAGSASETNRPHIDSFCDWVREGAERASDMLKPPEAAGKHFREARIEFWRGIRELIDRRIDHLSRTGTKGTRVVVE
ncbi:MAG: hypothetical protein M3Y72_02180 [Acidobacteriota bacterium]|nr:hypothetical protein [Acidobacteriota bacterium]